MGEGGLRSHPDLDHDLKNFERLESLVRELVDRHAALRGEHAETLAQISLREERIDELEERVLALNQSRQDAAKRIDELISQLDRVEAELDRRFEPLAED
jgi:chromosome segregation ATPase